MLWDAQKTSSTGIPGLASPGSKRPGVAVVGPTVEGRGLLRHKRSVSAIASLNPPVTSTAVGGSTSTRGKKADEEKPKIGMGMSLRSRTTTKDGAVPSAVKKAEGSKQSSTPVGVIAMEPATGKGSSKRTSQMTLPPAQARSGLPSKIQTRPAPEPIRRSVRLGHAKEPSPATEESGDSSVVEVRATRRRSMMPLSFVQVETSGEEEVLQASGSEEVLTMTAGHAKEEEVETNRQDALDRLMGAGGQSVSAAVGMGSVRSRTTGANTTITSPRTIAATRTATPARGQPVTTRRAATPTGMKTLGAVQGKSKGDQPPVTLLTKAGPTMRNSTRVVSNANAGVGALRDAGKIPKLTMTPDVADGRDPMVGQDPVDGTVVDGGDRGSSTLTSASASPVSHQTPRSKLLLLSPGSAPSTSTRTSPSSRDPLTRLRGTPVTGKDSPRSRKSSNNSDIGVMMEQSRRTWLRGPSGEGDSPLTGRISELKGDSPRSSRVKRVAVGRASSGVTGAGRPATDVFGMDKGTSAKIAALEAQLKAMQETSEREKMVHERQTNEAREREAIKQMLLAVKSACESELEMLERRRAEKERMVDAFDRAVGMVISTL